MLRPGRYKSEHDGNVFQAYRYVMEVKETAKSYIFKLLEVENRYADDHIEIMFGGKKRIVLPKENLAVMQCECGVTTTLRFTPSKPASRSTSRRRMWHENPQVCL